MHHHILSFLRVVGGDAYPQGYIILEEQTAN